MDPMKPFLTRCVCVCVFLVVFFFVKKKWVKHLVVFGKPFFLYETNLLFVDETWGSVR